MKQFFCVLICCITFSGKAQNLYFPPLTGSTWNTIDPASLGWCQNNIDSLYAYLEATNTKGFMLLKDGNIVLEKYFGTFTKDSLWVWNSAGKTLTGFAVGIAQQENFLSIDDTTSHYLGQGWTSLTPQQEEKITIRNQLTMTSGLGYVGDWYCTEPNCLIYVADPNVRWSYHNGPYTLLDQVIEAATGMSLNAFVNQKISSQIGMSGLFVQVGYNNLFVSTVRSMARFGLLLQGSGTWDGNQIMTDQNYFQEMTNSSQSMNPSYGYLTWLNGKSSYMVPSPDFQLSIPGYALPNAPADIIAAMGKNGQILNVSPSTGFCLVRMGDDDLNSNISNQYNDTIWQKVNALPCPAGLNTSVLDHVSIIPNPSTDYLIIQSQELPESIQLFDLQQHEVQCTVQGSSVDVSELSPGIYFLALQFKGKRGVYKIIKN